MPFKMKGKIWHKMESFLERLTIFVLILAEALDWITLTGVAIKFRIMNILGNSNFSMPSEKGKLDALVVMALSLPRCGILASLTHFCTNLLRS